MLDSGKKIQKKNGKKIEKIKKNIFPTLFFAKTGWDRPRKRKKKFYFRIPFILDRGKKIPKKIGKKLINLKTSFGHYFLPKRDEIGRDGEKKKFYFRIPFILDSGEKIPKKNSKKIEKIKKPLSDIIFSQKGMR